MLSSETISKIRDFINDWQSDHMDADPTYSRHHYYVCATWADYDQSFKEWYEGTDYGANIDDDLTYRWENACDMKRQIERESNGDVTAVIIDLD